MPDLKTMAPQAKIYKTPPFTVEAPGYKKVEGETIPRRNTRTKDQLKLRPSEDITTIYDVLRHSAKKFGNAKALGSRKVVKTHHETKKVRKMVDGKEQEVDKNWTFFELSEYHYMSFIEYEKLALQVGMGFRKLGMNKGDRVHIFAATSPHWLATAHGASSQSMPIVTAYDTLGEEGLKHSLAQTHAKAIFLDPHLLTKLINPLKEVKDIQHVIYNTGSEVKRSDIDKLKDAHPHLTIQSFDELIKLGENNPIDPVPPQPEDLCCIMYTSGSTGAPKGVLLKHKNVVAAIAGVDVIVGPYLGPGDGLLTYLPLAHILEFVFETACLYWGGTMGYGNPKTLSDSSVKNCKGDIRRTKESFTDDGWFKTGDIGEFDKRGHLRIIDRKKNLVKTLNGEYIALEKLESIYRSATVVANICVYAASDRNKPIAIIVPAEPALKSLASSNGIKGSGIEDLVHNDKLNKLVLAELQAAGKKGGLAGIEIIEGVVLADEEWTPQNGLTTSAQKINRKGILEKYKKEVDKAYSNSS
ncbi:hypothetical protein B0A49_03235 [Cryomyces minteri]|uniref:AMP-dependent synthetase/ligase domain-containing protein n=1 Tax=Cryomyces minteri TaxID=331657 RepID=A0A4U0XIA7_9PEZI|nr:hypothetical protein B0A49_03235 [Cryomyces minteri]